MRLSIRYSVDETELANEAHLLFTKAHDKFGSVRDLVVRQMMHSAVLRETDKMASSIVELRKAMLIFLLSFCRFFLLLFLLNRQGCLLEDRQQSICLGLPTFPGRLR